MQHVAAANAQATVAARHKLDAQMNSMRTTNGRNSALGTSFTSGRQSSIRHKGGGGSALGDIAALALAEKDQGNKRIAGIGRCNPLSPSKKKENKSKAKFAPDAPTKEEDEDDDEPTPRCIIMPDSNFRLTWDMGMLVLILYNVFAIPVSICFSLEVPPTNVWFWFEFAFDIIFLIDCFAINFNTAVQTEAHGLSMNRWVIAREYFSFWFWIDFPSSIPLSQAFKISAYASGEIAGDEASALRVIQFIRLARILKLIRLMKAAKIFRILEEELEINVSVLKLFKMMFGVLFMCHVMGCCCYWIAVSVQEPYVFGMFRPPEWWGCELNTTEAPWAPDDFGAPVITSSSIFKEPNVVVIEVLTGRPRAPDGFCPPPVGGLVQGRWIEKMDKGWLYMWVLYWTITTMTTIGYGDISPMTPLEVGMTMVVQMVGAVLFGYIIGNIATLVADFNQYETAYKLRMESIKTYLNHKRVPKEMKRRVRKFCHHYYQRKGVMRESWEMLPPRLKREVLNFEHKEFFGIFARLSVGGCEEVLHRLAEAVRPAHVVAGAYFVDAEIDPCTEIAFVADGEIAVLYKHARSRCKSTKTLAGAGAAPSKPSDQGSFLGALKRVSLNSASVADSERASTGSARDSATGAPPLVRSDTMSSRALGTKRTGTWFGHFELLEVYDAATANGSETAMSADIPWQHSYRARVATELLLLIKDDFFLLLDEYPYLRDLLNSEGQIGVPAHTPAACASRPPAPACTAVGAVSSTSVANSLATIPSTPHHLASTWDVAEEASGGGSGVQLDADAKPTILARRAADKADAAAAPASAACSSDAGGAGNCEGGDEGEGEGGADGEDDTPDHPQLRRQGTSATKRKAWSKAMLAVQQDSNASMRRTSSGNSMRAGASKSPKGAVVKGLGSGGMPMGQRSTDSASFNSPTQRASWQKLRRFKDLKEAGAPSAVGAPSAAGASGGAAFRRSDLSETSDMGSPPSSCALGPYGGGGAGGGAGDAGADWFKQRVACELLGDAPCAPWEIEDDTLFQRLSLVITQANAVLHASGSLGGDGSAAPSPAAGGAAGKGKVPFAVLQLLLTMQRTVQENADVVRTYLEQLEGPLEADGAAPAALGMSHSPVLLEQRVLEPPALEPPGGARADAPAPAADGAE